MRREPLPVSQAVSSFIQRHDLRLANAGSPKLEDLTYRSIERHLGLEYFRFPVASNIATAVQCCQDKLKGIALGLSKFYLQSALVPCLCGSGLHVAQFFWCLRKLAFYFEL